LALVVVVVVVVVEEEEEEEEESYISQIFWLGDIEINLK
jgi:hypothetical protein